MSIKNNFADEAIVVDRSDLKQILELFAMSQLNLLIQIHNESERKDVARNSFSAQYDLFSSAGYKHPKVKSEWIIDRMNYLEATYQATQKVLEIHAKNHQGVGH